MESKVSTPTAPTTTLGRYQIVKHLAQGGMADVLIARTSGIEGFERHVVIKRIRAEQARDERYVSMFLDEARLAASLHHHNVVQVNDIGEQEGEYFFAMEYVHGEDVRALLTRLSERDEDVPLEHVLTIVTAAAAGLHHAHEQRGPDRAPLGIVHRDVSPANILIGYDGAVKVADFGIAKAAHRSTETQSGTLKGKVAYMSPEQCVGEEVDRRSDVFSLGIVLYELCTVRRLFKGDNDFLTMTSIVLGHIPPPSRFRTDLPPALEEIILRALANKPADRYATADELRLALDQFAAKHGLRTSSTTLADYVKAQFGERLEPWLVDDDEDEPEIELGVDFDGSASGVVQPPISAIASFEIPHRAAQLTPVPIARARHRAITAGQVPQPRAETELERPTGRPGSVAVADPPAAASAVEPSAPIAPPRGRRWWQVGAVVAVAVIAASIALVAASSGGGGQPARPPPIPARHAPVPAHATEPANPGASPSAIELTPPVVAPSPPPPTRTIRKKPAARPTPAPRWDPDALFPSR